MRILQLHNEYRKAGGEDGVAEREAELLQRSGHTVRRHVASNWDVRGLTAKLRTAWYAPYSPDMRRRIGALIREAAPDVVHVHNFFPVLTPAVYDACADCRVPVVQTLHNYRLICPKAMLLRDGQPCDLCVTGSPYNAVRYRCYRDSAFWSVVPARMVSKGRKHGTWHKVDRYIALSEFGRQQFIDGGLPADRIGVKPNFLEDPVSDGADGPRSGALFVGRLSAEKGISTLLEAWQELDVPLRVLGDGPLMTSLEQAGNNAISVMGQRDHDEIIAEMRRASFLVLPSIWYEGFPLVIVEAFACGLPIVASRIGALAELIEDGQTGRLAPPGDPRGLADMVRWAAERPVEMRTMGGHARQTYERLYTPEVNLHQLLALYEAAIATQQAA